MSRFLLKYYLFQFTRNLHFFGAVLVVFYTQWAGLTQTQVQLTQSWFAFSIFAFELPTGIIADRFSRRLSISLGLLITSLGFIFYALWPNFHYFLLMETVLALGMALVSGADQAWLYDSLIERGQTNQADHIIRRADSFSKAGLLVSALVGGYIGQRYGLQYPIIATGLVLLVATFVSLTFREPAPTGSESESRRFLHLLTTAITYLRRHRQTRKLVVDTVSLMTLSYFVIWFYQPRLVAAGVPIGWFGLFHAGLLLAEIVVVNSFWRLEKLAGSTARALTWAGGLTAVGYLIASTGATIGSVSSLLLLSGGFGLSYRALVAGEFNRRLPSDIRATLNSSLTMFRGLALILLNPLFGYLADRSLSATFVVLAGLTVLATFLMRRDLPET